MSQSPGVERLCHLLGWWAGVVVLGLYLMSCVCGCQSPAPPSPVGPTAADVALYEADQLNCIDNAETREGADGCREIVKRAWQARWGAADGGER